MLKRFVDFLTNSEQQTPISAYLHGEKRTKRRRSNGILLSNKCHQGKRMKDLA